jgi:hypothetical protein
MRARSPPAPRHGVAQGDQTGVLGCDAEWDAAASAVAAGPPGRRRTTTAQSTSFVSLKTFAPDPPIDAAFDGRRRPRFVPPPGKARAPSALEETPQPSRPLFPPLISERPLVFLSRGHRCVVRPLFSTSGSRPRCLKAALRPAASGADARWASERPSVGRRDRGDSRARSVLSRPSLVVSVRRR